MLKYKFKILNIDYYVMYVTGLCIIAENLCQKLRNYKGRYRYEYEF